MHEQILKAVEHLNRGGVIAYPTEHCFGLGCDPRNEVAVRRIAAMKNRLVEQGVLLVAGNITQVEEYASLTASSQISQIRATWPGPVTWTLKPNNKMPLWVVGQHNTVAIRVSGHSVCIDLCNEFSGAIVSTSANRHGQAVLKTWQEVEQEFLGDIDYIVRAEIGGRDAPSQIRDGETGEVLR